tara:strand:+ start:829 stop:1023 length:195 start_codon:yes stop_codon:yes gene_type:complete
MPFKTTYFETRQQALAYFNKVAREHIAFLALDKENGRYFVANEQDYAFFSAEWDLDMSLELCSE